MTTVPVPDRARALGGHLPALDGVRGLAILMVLLFHFVAHTTATNRWEAAIGKVLSYGSLGVDLSASLRKNFLGGSKATYEQNGLFIELEWMYRSFSIETSNGGALKLGYVL